MTIVELARGVTGGVDTHLDVHVAAALDERGGLLGSESFPVTPGGYRDLLGWMSAFGPVTTIGMEGTGAFGLEWLITGLSTVANGVATNRLTRIGASGGSHGRG